jgi:SAM-dependent methyltransferase
MKNLAPEPYLFPHYLAAKKSVDDRALNRHVWQSLCQALPLSNPQKPLRVLEVGCGIGTMLERMLDWQLFNCASYTGLDAMPENIETAWSRINRWADEHAMQSSRQNDTLLMQDSQRWLSVKFHTADLFDFIAVQAEQQTWDLLVAHAFLDLVDIPSALPKLFSLLQPGGLFYFTINFDGASLLEPAIDPAFDELVERLYHLSMDQRITAGKPSGDSRAGRHMFQHLIHAGASITAAGSSDWVVFANHGVYPADEAYFLHFILHFYETALMGNPGLDARRFQDWLAQRHTQVEDGKLVYIAHQLDFYGSYG